MVDEIKDKRTVMDRLKEGWTLMRRSGEAWLVKDGAEEKVSGRTVEVMESWGMVSDGKLTVKYGGTR